VLFEVPLSLELQEGNLCLILLIFCIQLPSSYKLEEEWSLSGGGVGAYLPPSTGIV